MLIAAVAFVCTAVKNWGSKIKERLSEPKIIQTGWAGLRYCLSLTANLCCFVPTCRTLPDGILCLFIDWLLTPGLVNVTWTSGGNWRICLFYIFSHPPSFVFMWLTWKFWCILIMCVGRLWLCPTRSSSPLIDRFVFSKVRNGYRVPLSNFILRWVRLMLMETQKTKEIKLWDCKRRPVLSTCWRGNKILQGWKYGRGL